MTDYQLPIRDQQIVVAGQTVVRQGVEPAAQLALHHQGMEASRPQLAVEGGELHGAHGLTQHLGDGLLLGDANSSACAVAAGVWRRYS